MKDRVEEYIESKTWADSTKKGVSKILIQFLKQLKEKEVLAFEDIERDFFVSWIAKTHQSYSQSSINKHLYAIYGFLKWQVNEGYLLTNPFPEELYRQKKPLTIVKSPSKRTVFDALQLELKVVYPLRDKAILELLYSTGIRSCELVSLNVADIMSEDIRIIGKGDKERIVPIGATARKAIFEYLQLERPKIIARTGARETSLIVSYHNGKRLSGQGIRAITKKYGLTPHSLRHACATHMLQNGCGIAVLQKLLGHSDINTTEIYTTVETSDLQKMLREYHPIENIPNT